MRHATKIPRICAGFTMVELVVAMGIVAVLVMVAGPALSALVMSQQMKGASYDLSSTLTQARSEALTRNVAVTVTPAAEGWAAGWTVTEESGTMLRRQSAYPRISVSGPAHVVFSGDGRPDSIATPFAVSAADIDPADGRCLRLRLHGRSYIVKGAC